MRLEESNVTGTSDPVPARGFFLEVLVFFACRDDNRFVKRVAGGRCRGGRTGCLGHGDHPVPRPATRNYGNCFRHCHSAVAHSDCADYYHRTGRAHWVAFATKDAAGGTHIATHHNFPSSRHQLLDSILCAPAWIAHPAPGHAESINCAL